MILYEVLTRAPDGSTHYMICRAPDRFVLDETLATIYRTHQVILIEEMPDA